MKKRWIVPAGSIGIVTLAVAAVLLWPSAVTKSDGGRANAAAGGVPAFITDLASWQHNGENGRYYAPVIDGATPARATLGTVRTDTDCTPDAQGLSHCHNVIELLSGGTITVQDNHDMTVNRCLSPGEEITVTPIAPGWVRLRTRVS